MCLNIFASYALTIGHLDMQPTISPISPTQPRQWNIMILKGGGGGDPRVSPYLRRVHVASVYDGWQHGPARLHIYNEHRSSLHSFLMVWTTGLLRLPDLYLELCHGGGGGGGGGGREMGVGRGCHCPSHSLSPCLHTPSHVIPKSGPPFVSYTVCLWRHIGIGGFM